MKKLLGIVVLGLLLISNNSYSKEEVLRCIISNDSGNKFRYEVEVNLKEKKLYQDGDLFKIVTVGDRTIIAKKETLGTVKLDRFDGYYVLQYLNNGPTVSGYCKKYNKIF